MVPPFYPAPARRVAPDIAEILAEHRGSAQAREEASLHARAAHSKDHSRYFGREDDHRLPYKRDVDRIVHSRAFSRYIDKTQVVYLVRHEHLTRRLLHVQLVSSFARGIAEILGLNCDLVEAIALGHDVGHPPFGHEGESYLSALVQEAGLGAFSHSAQSCRLFREIEPLNLGLAVYDGFLCHDGGMSGTAIRPRWGKSWEDHFEELAQRAVEPEHNLMPATLEGCLVKLCDTISYLGRDLEDAIRIGLVKREELPHTRLGSSNRDMLSALAADIIQHSFQEEKIALSDEIYEALAEVRRFNFDHFYLNPALKSESGKIKRSYRILFETLFNDRESKGEESYLWKRYLHNKPTRYLHNSTSAEQVVDYLSGMTDSYFVRTLEELVIPTRIELWRTS
jgi:dGTPase